MNQGARKSGIDVIGDVPWGTHFGLFYKTKQDLVDILVPYFVAGLKNNEFCMWVTAEPLNAEEAKACMVDAIPDFDVYVDKGQIEIIPYSEWYKINSVFDSELVLNGWVEKLRNARERGFSGLGLRGTNHGWSRVSGRILLTTSRRSTRSSANMTCWPCVHIHWINVMLTILWTW